MNNRLATLFLVLLVVLAPAFLFYGVYLGGHPWLLPSPVRDVLVDGGQSESVDEALDLIEQDYYRKIDRDKLDNDSIAGAVKALNDRFSNYLDPHAYKLYNEASSGAFSGVGMNVAEDRKGLRVIALYPHSPAKRAGVKPDDLITKVGGRSIAGRSSRVSTALIKGKPGTHVSLTIVSHGKARVERIKRARIQIPNVLSTLRTVGGSKQGVVRLGSFISSADSEVRAAVDQLLKRGAKGVVLDLRANPGGLLNQAVAVASIFLPEGETVVSTEGRSSPKRVFKATGDPISTKVPIVVLVDRNTASAAEIVAAALQDHGRAKVVGARTFGKGVFQQIEPLLNGGALDITIGEYFTPNAHNLGGGGVKRGSGVHPDVQAQDRLSTSRDDALQQALKTLANKTQ